MEDMEAGVRYIVSKASTDGTFDVGDHVRLLNNGDVSCSEAMGWIDAVDVPDACTGAEVEQDSAWMENRKRQLLSELEALRVTRY